MRKKLLSLSFLIAFLAILQTQAQTDVTATYLLNPGFDKSCNYLASATASNLASGTTNNQTINGWTLTASVGNSASSAFEYGYAGTLNSPGPIPSRSYNYEIGAGHGTLGVSVAWTATVTYYQNVTLPAGTYTIEYAAYNSGPNAADISKVGWVPTSGTTVVSAKTTFAQNAWTTERLTFTLATSTPGKIQVGLSCTNVGSASVGRIFFDYVKIYQVDAGKTTLQQLKDSSQIVYNNRPSVVTTTAYSNLNTKIAAAQVVYDNVSATASQIQEQQDSLSTALSRAYRARLTVQDATAIIVNPSFEWNNFVGWTNPATFVTQSNASFAKTGSYYVEKYKASPGTQTASKLSQIIRDIPNGVYQVTAAAQGILQTTPAAYPGGAYVYANTSRTEVFISNNYSATYTVTNNQIEIGFDVVSSGNWVTADNFRLTYISDGSPAITVAPTSLAYNFVTSSQTFTLSGVYLTTDVTLSSTDPGISFPKSTYTAAEVMAGQTVTVNYDKAIGGASGTITITGQSGAVTKTVSFTYTAPSSKLSSLTPSAGFLSPTFDGATTTYTLLCAPGSRLTGVAADASIGSTVSNNPATILTNGAITQICSAPDATTTTYTTTATLMPFSYWSGNGDLSATSVASNYGWSATPSLTWTVANSTTSGTVRYMDIVSGVNAGIGGVTFTYASSNYDGRILFQRWDGSASRVYSYPVYLEGCKSYNITGKAAWNSVASAPTVTFRVNSTNDNTGTTYASANVVTTTAGTLIDVSMSNFSVPTTGVYYITTTSNTLSMIAVSDLAIAENTSESMGVSPISLLMYTNNLSKTFTVSGNLLTNDVTLSAPEGIILSATGITPGKDITIPKADAQCGVIVTATWNNANAIVNLPIHVTSGAFSQDVTVYADKNDCSAPLYGDHTNLITEPFMNVLTSYTNSWGALSVATGAESYCGYGSAKLTGENAASLTTSNISWSPNTKYRVRAMIKTTGEYQLGFQNTYAGTGATYEIVIPSTNGVWTQVDYVFTTGANAVAGYTYFNGRGGSLGYIDNWELYNISDLVSEPDFAVKAWEQKVDQNISTTTFTVAPSARLTVNATRTLTATTLNLQSNIDGTATMLNNGTLAISTANVQQYMTTGRNWYFSSPVTGATKSAVNATDMYRYNEPTETWLTIASEDPLAVGQGYVANPSGNGVATFTGALNDGIVDLNLTRTEAVAKSGFFLVGNPYPSYLNWLSATKTTMNPTVWYRTKHAITNAYVFETYNAELSEGSDVSGRVPVTAFIPPMQAFWVRVANNSASGSIQFTNAMRTHMDITQNKFRSEAVQQVLRLRISNGVNEDEAIVAFNSNASNDLDNFDSQKMSNNSLSIPEIFTVAGNEQLVINGMNAVTPNMEMSLGFFTKSANKFSIRASQISNFDADTKILLKDKVLNQEFDLTDASSYYFSSEVANTTDRFSILFKSTSGTTGLKNDKVLADMKAFRNENNKIQINYLGSISKDASYKIYSINGQLISNGIITNATTVVAKSLNSGIYLVKLLNEGNVLTTKVLVY